MNYSQETYPKLTVIKEDTCVILTVNQVSSINIVFEENRALKEKVFVLDSIIVQKDSLSSKKDSIVGEKQVLLNDVLNKYADKDKELNKVKKNRKLFYLAGFLTAVLAYSLIKFL